MSAAGQNKADLIAALKAVTASLEHLTDRDVTYWGGEIRMDVGAHWKAIHDVRIARQAVVQARAALASEPEPQPVAEPYAYGELLWYDCGDGRRLNAQYRRMDEGWIVAAFADGSVCTVRPSRLSLRRAASPHLAETAPDQEGQTGAAIRSLTAPGKEGA